MDVHFTTEEYEMIQQYMKYIEAISIQAAILNAVSIALDEV